MNGSHLRLVPEQAARAIPGDIAGLIATQGLPLVRRLAAKYAGANDVGVNEGDFLSLGQSMLAEVGPDYDKGHGARFTTYVFPFVDGAMKDAIRRRRHEERMYAGIGRAIERERRQFASTQSDEFNVLHNAADTTRAQLDDTMSELAARLAGTAVVTANDLLRRGTEEGIREAKSHTVAVNTIHEAIPMMEPVLQELWQLHYEEGLTLKDYAKAMGISIATAKNHHKKFKDRLRDILTNKGCG